MSILEWFCNAIYLYSVFLFTVVGLACCIILLIVAIKEI